MGIEVILGTRVTGIDDKGLTAERDRSGRVIVNEDFSIPDHRNVFVAGDLTLCIDVQTGQPVPAVAQAAIQGGKFVGKMIAAEIRARRLDLPSPKRAQISSQR